jgi:hypothetical protein
MGSRLQSNETPPAAKVDTLMLGPNFSQLPVLVFLPLVFPGFPCPGFPHYLS